MFDAMLVTKLVKWMNSVGLGAWLLGELDAVISQHRVNAIRQGF